MLLCVCVCTKVHNTCGCGSGCVNLCVYTVQALFGAIATKINQTVATHNIRSIYKC